MSKISQHCRQEGQDVAQIVQIQPTFQFCPICSFFADSSFLPDFSFREFPIFAGFLFVLDFWPGFGKFGAKVWAGGEVRIAKAWKFQKHFRNLWHQCIYSALQSRTQCNVEMKKKSHHKSGCLICCSGIEGCLAQTIRVKWHTQLLIQSIYQFMCTMMIHNFCIYAI